MILQATLRFGQPGSSQTRFQEAISVAATVNAAANQIRTITKASAMPLGLAPASPTLSRS
jgi:hypothetical protein